jgi:hypothetical protein
MCTITVAKSVACTGGVLVPFGNSFFEYARQRARLIDLLYWVMHAIDDIVDKDAPVPEGYTSALAYIERVIQFVELRDKPRDRLERTFGYVLDLAGTLKMGLAGGIRDILHSMQFDAIRLSKPGLQIFSDVELKYHFHLLDISGTVTLWLIILRERMSALPAITMLGEAARIYYNLRDLEEDMRARLCNIPREAFIEFWIPVPNDLSAIGLARWSQLPEVQEWRAAEARRGRDLFNAYMLQKASLGLHPFTNRILHNLFEVSVERGLRSQGL